MDILTTGTKWRRIRMNEVRIWNWLKHIIFLFFFLFFKKRAWQSKILVQFWHSQEMMKNAVASIKNLWAWSFSLCTQKVDLDYIWSSSQIENCLRASSIHLCRQFSTAWDIVNQLLVLVLCSGHDSSSSFTNKANIEALHRPSGQHSSWCVLLLKW